MGEIIAVRTGAEGGGGKKDRETGLLIRVQGLTGDSHAGSAHRPVSLPAAESAGQRRAQGAKAKPDDLAGSLLTRGIDRLSLSPGTRLKAGAEAILRVTPPHRRCAAGEQAGERVTTQQEIWAEVLQGGPLRAGDPLEVLPHYRFGIIIVSDKGAAGEREDRSGPLLGELLFPRGDIARRTMVPDEHSALTAELRRMVAEGLNAVFTSGGTGLSPRDITPEATLEVVERLVPGIPEAMRRETFSATPRAMLSRAAAGISGQTLIINLPGSPKAVRECFAVLEAVLDHALETLSGRGGECGAEK
ncbi:MAG: molybdenum cofactor biosynthesis protein [Firmicutes bacterium]|nr:molybdenum cofactor biosynthesis protein [Bacillota bacterium]